jgi:hypothetical protein
MWNERKEDRQQADRRDHEQGFRSQKLANRE